MKRESKMLLNKAIDSLILSVELFNRPYDQGRSASVLIMLDHSFEMLLKSAILHRGGRIREKRAKQTIGFDSCVRIGLSNGDVKFLTEDQALLLQAINGLRDAAQHHILEISEAQLYMHAQAGVTLFCDLMGLVFDMSMINSLPDRVLPLATQAPTDLEALFENEIEEIRKLLKPGTRRQAEAMARIRPLAILDATLKGEKGQPDRTTIREAKEKIRNNVRWDDIFPGVGSVHMTTEGAGPVIQLRLTKKAGEPIHLVPEGTPGASVVAVKRVNELGYYSLGLNKLAELVGLTPPTALAVIKKLGVQKSEEYFKVLKIGGLELKRYSQKAITKMKEEIPSLNMLAVWQEYGSKRRRRK